MNIKPLADRVLVLPAPAEEKIGGIIIPDTAKEKPLHGKIDRKSTRLNSVTDVSRMPSSA